MGGGENEKKEEAEGNIKEEMEMETKLWEARATWSAGCDGIIQCLEDSGALRRAACVLTSYLNKRKQETVDFTQHALLHCVPAALSTSFCCFFSRTNPRE